MDSIKAKKYLRVVPDKKALTIKEQQLFISSLEELLDEVGQMKKDLFWRYHEKDKFSDWIDNVIGDSHLADVLEDAKFQKEFCQRLKSHIWDLESVASPKKGKSRKNNDLEFTFFYS